MIDCLPSLTQASLSSQTRTVAGRGRTSLCTSGFNERVAGFTDHYTLSV